MEMNLVLPNNYVELEQEAMMYVDGGDGWTFANNIYGYKYTVGFVRRNAFGIPSATVIAKWGYWTTVAYFPVLATKLSALTGNPVIIGIVAIGAVAAVTYLWNNRVFY